MSARTFPRVLPAVLFASLLLAGCSLFGRGRDQAAAVIPAANTDGAPTVYIPSGTYRVGSDASDPDALPAETPLHQVTLTGYNLYTSEVTNAMYQACVSAGGCLPISGLRGDLIDYFDSGAYADYPVVGVDWSMANDYCRWAGGRLPTEAEWEVAARGTDGRLYPWGNDPATCQNSAVFGCGKGDLPYPVGSFANGNSPYGAWDMAGNVWEWVNDWYDANYYAASEAADPLGPWGGDFKVVRGGGWNSTADDARSAGRYALDPTQSYRDLGFRCVANSFPVEETIGVPGPTHSGGPDGGRRSVDDTRRTPIPPPAERWTWDRLSPACAAGPTGILTVGTWNDFGGVWSASIDGAPASCSYNEALRVLTCTWPLAAPRGGPSGSDYYLASFTMTAPDGSRVTDMNIPVRPERFAGCTGATGSTLAANARVTCSAENVPMLAVEVPLALSITGISGDVTFGDPARECAISISGGATNTVCPLPASFSGRTIGGQVSGLTLDGAASLSAAFSSVAVPTCGESGGAGPARISVTPACGEGGESIFNVDWSPRDALGIRQVQDALTGTDLACFHNPDRISLHCRIPGTSLSGEATVRITSYNRSDRSFNPPQTFSFTPARCPGSIPSFGPLSFGSPVCRPDGMPGLVSIITYTGMFSRVVIESRYGGLSSSCSPGLAPNQFVCYLPAPIPTDLQICYHEFGGGEACIPNPYAGTTLPASCGGSSSAPAGWSLGLACGAGSSPYRALVTVTGGRLVDSMGAVVGASSLSCTPVAGAAGTFRCDLPTIAIGVNPEFVARFTDGSEERHTFPDFALLLPPSCPADSGGAPTGGGVCADIPTVTGWQNPVNRFDVNNDGCVRPIDALQLISRLSAPEGGTLATPRPAGSPFYDVNGDGSLTPRDALETINYINGHAGEACTPTCESSASGEEWSLEVVCDPIHSVFPDYVQFRAHVPGSIISRRISDPYPGCFMGGLGPGDTVHTTSDLCRPGTDYSAPMTFVVLRLDGTTVSHTFTDVGTLAATCPAPSSPAPEFFARTTCSTGTPGTYDALFTWTPTSYPVNAIRDSSGRDIPTCAICSVGSCTCTGLRPGPDELIRLQMVNRSGGTEVITPLTISPPVCGGSGAGEYRLTAECDPRGDANVAILHFTFPPGMRPDLRELSGMRICILIDPGNTADCVVDLTRVTRGPLTLPFIGPDPDWDRRTLHTFTEFDSVVPTTCAARTGSDDIRAEAVCSGSHAVVRMTTSLALAIEPQRLNGVAFSPGECLNSGTSSVSCMLPDSLMGTTATLDLVGRNSYGTALPYTYSVAIPACGSDLAPGDLYWILWCREGHAVFELRSNSGLNIRSFTVNGVAPASSACTGMGTPDAFCTVPDSWQNVPSVLHLDATDGAGVVRSLPDSALTFGCGGTPASGWSLSSAVCAEGGGRVQVTLDYPVALRLSSYSVLAGDTRFSCSDIRGARTAQLVCYGATSWTTSPLSVIYTADGREQEAIFPEYATRAPRFCAMACSAYTNESGCSTARCYWWTDSTCNDRPQSCSVLTEESACSRAGCYWWTDGSCNDRPKVCADFTTLDSCYSIPSMNCKWTDPSGPCYLP